MSKLLALIAIVVVVLLGFFVFDASKPRVVAKVQFDASRLVVTNGNDQPWRNVTLILNEAFGGPQVVIAGEWAPGETREFALASFVGPLNKQAFRPDFEKVREVIVTADGFSLASYR